MNVVGQAQTVAKSRRSVALMWAGLFAVAVLLDVAVLVFGPSSSYGPWSGGLKVAAGASLPVLAVAVWASLLPIAATLTVDQDGLSRGAFTHRRRKYWTWDEFSAGEVQKKILGPVIVLRRQVGSHRPKKVQPAPGFAAPSAIDDLAAAIGAHIPVTRRPARGRYWRPPPAVTVAALVAALTCTVLNVPYGRLLREGPGTALHVKQQVAVPAALRHSHPGDILSLSVRFGPPTLLDVFHDRGNNAVRLVAPSVIFQHETPHQNAVTDASDNVLATTTAIYLALARTGHPLTVSGGQPVVRYSPPGSPLHPGDQVDAIGGTPTPYIEDLYAALENQAPDKDHPAQQVDVTVTDPQGHTDQRRVTLGVQGVVPHLATLGGALYRSNPLHTSTLPFPVAVDNAGEGGPSAGLATTLGLLDVLGTTPILEADRVAVTGTIAPDGRVGPIGGLRQKVALARAEGATLLIVPTDEVSVATAFAGPMRVVGARTLDEALAALHQDG